MYLTAKKWRGVINVGSMRLHTYDELIDWILVRGPELEHNLFVWEVACDAPPKLLSTSVRRALFARGTQEKAMPKPFTRP